MHQKKLSIHLHPMDISPYNDVSNGHYISSFPATAMSNSGVTPPPSRSFKMTEFKTWMLLHILLAILLDVAVQISVSSTSLFVENHPEIDFSWTNKTRTVHAHNVYKTVDNLFFIFPELVYSESRTLVSSVIMNAYRCYVYYVSAGNYFAFKSRSKPNPNQ